MTDLTVDLLTDPRLKSPVSAFYNLAPLTGKNRTDFIVGIAMGNWAAMDSIAGSRAASQLYQNAYLAGGPFYQFDGVKRVGTGQFHHSKADFRVIDGIGGLSDAQFAALKL